MKQLLRTSLFFVPSERGLTNPVRTLQLRVFHGDYAVTFTDSSGNVSPTQYVRIYDDNQSGQTQFVTVNV